MFVKLFQKACGSKAEPWSPSAEGEISYQTKFRLPLSKIKLWAFGEGNLYDVTIRYNEDGEGIALGTLKLSDQAATMPVSVSFGDAPNGLAGNELATFIAAQETFNDVLTSMMEDSRFTMAE